MFSLSGADIEVSPGDLSKLQAAIVKNIRMAKDLEQNIEKMKNSIGENKAEVDSLSIDVKKKARDDNERFIELENSLADLHINNIYVEGELKKIEKITENLNSLSAFLSKEIKRQQKDINEIKKKEENNINANSLKKSESKITHIQVPLVEKPEAINVLEKYLKKVEIKQ